MKSNQTIHAIFGLTQIQIACYLGITRSQWSMYCSGKRKLPLLATEKLADLLSFLKQNFVQNKESKSTKLEMKKLALTNELNQLTINRVIQIRKKEKIEQKIQNITTCKKVLQFLKKDATCPIYLLKEIEDKIKKNDLKLFIQKTIEINESVALKTRQIKQINKEIEKLILTLE